ncbi:single-stranded DNA-binding protein [Thermomonas brevis]
MSSVNAYAFTGRLGAPAEVKFTQGGTAIWSARVAVDYGWGDRAGTTWITAKALGKHAESLGKLDLQKGALIGGSGELQVREYDKRDGGKGTAVEVLVNGIALLGPKPDGSAAPRQDAPRQTPQQENREKAASSFDDVPLDDDIPF